MHLIKLVLIFSLSGIFRTYGQTLISFKVSATGSVTPIIQPYPFINPSRPNFQYPLKVVTDYCRDSVTIRSSFFNNYGPKNFNESKKVLCFNGVEVLDKHFYKNDGWVVSPDLAVMAGLDNQPRDFGAWTKMDDRTWQFKSSYASYSSYVTGPRIIQIWKLDRKKRVKEVIQTNDSGLITLAIKIFYSRCNLVSGISKTIYDDEYYRGNMNFFAQVHQVWFYDKKKRVKMMIKYSGKYQRLSVRKRELFQQKLATYIHSGKEPPDSDLDSLNIRDLVTYYYGRFGLETVNFCRKEAHDLHGPYSYPRKYVSDSIFYNSYGQIVHYSCPKTWDGYSNKIVFTYDTYNNRLTSYFGSSTWAFADGNDTETAASLLIDYDSNGIINHSKQLRFEKTYRRPALNLTAPDSKPEEEIEKWYHWN
jgi:hypothetical protein